MVTFADKAKQLGATSFTPCSKNETFRADGAKILWQPGVYQGNGSENRVNICIQSEEASEMLSGYEDCLEGNLCSVVKDCGNMYYVRAKMQWDKVHFFNAENERVSKPPTLAGYNCNVMFHIKGKWASHGQVGLSVEVTDIQLLEPEETDYKSPFL